MGDKLTNERLKELLFYNPDTGIFTWLKTSSTRVKPGMKAGSLLRGYLRIEIGGKKYPAHRLAWFYVYETWPDRQIDHINRKRNDNRIANLRLATNSENQQNVGLKANNKTGCVGVDWMAGPKCKKRWRAGIKIDGSFKSLGYFSTFEEAVEARKKAETVFHPYRAALKEDRT